VVTGPRRSMFVEARHASPLRVYFATPFGDMMIAGCFGLLAATADVMPNLAESIYGSLREGGRRRLSVTPWDNPSYRSRI